MYVSLMSLAAFASVTASGRLDDVESTVCVAGALRQSLVRSILELEVCDDMVHRFAFVMRYANEYIACQTFWTCMRRMTIVAALDAWFGRVPFRIPLLRVIESDSLELAITERASHT